ncbi:hypothetical protein H4I96_03601 [Botrytis cinerea]
MESNNYQWPSLLPSLFDQTQEQNSYELSNFNQAQGRKNDEHLDLNPPQEPNNHWRLEMILNNEPLVQEQRETLDIIKTDHGQLNSIIHEKAGQITEELVSNQHPDQEWQGTEGLFEQIPQPLDYDSEWLLRADSNLSDQPTHFNIDDDFQKYNPQSTTMPTTVPEGTITSTPLLDAESQYFVCSSYQHGGHAVAPSARELRLESDVKQLKEQMRWLLDRIPTTYNLMASAMTWILLAGYLVLPSTFTSLQKSTAVAEKAGKAGNVVLGVYQNLPLLWVAAIFCLIGASDKKLAEDSERPGFINSITGLGTTVINIYTAREGVWSVTAIVTTAVTGTCTVFMLTMLVLYNFKLLENVKRDHKRRLERFQRVDRTLSWSDY